jgi:hypothetical protein
MSIRIIGNEFEKNKLISMIMEKLISRQQQKKPSPLSCLEKRKRNLLGAHGYKVK